MLVGVGVGVGVGEYVVVVVVGECVVVVVVVKFEVVVVVVSSDILYVKSLGKQTDVEQSGQSGLNILKIFFNKLKLCFTSGADNGVTYILNCEIAPSKVPAKFCSINILVFNPLNVVPDKSLIGKFSGSCIYGP